MQAHQTGVRRHWGPVRRNIRKWHGLFRYRPLGTHSDGDGDILRDLQYVRLCDHRETFSRIARGDTTLGGTPDGSGKPCVIPVIGILQHLLGRMNVSLIGRSKAMSALTPR